MSGVHDDVALRSWSPLEATLEPLSAHEFATAVQRQVPARWRHKTEYRRIVRVDGLSAAVHVRPGEEANGCGVVLLHGLGDDCTYPFWLWIDALVRQGYEVASFDLPGHGVGNTDLLFFDEAAQRVLAGVNALLLQRSSTKWALVGHSFGGRLALELASTPSAARLFAGAVLVSPALALGTPAEMAREGLGFVSPTLWREVLWPLKTYYTWRGLFPAAGSFRRADFPIRLPKGPTYVQAFREYLARRPLQAALVDIDKPLFWLHGTRDFIAPRAQAEAILSAVTTLEAVPLVGATHWNASAARRTLTELSFALGAIFRAP